MIYSCIRVVIIALLLIVLFLIFKHKLKFIKKKHKALILVFIFVLYYILWLLPFENCFMSFKTPEEAYNYRYKYPNNVIEKVIECKNSALVLSVENGNSFSYDLFPKLNGDYKLSNSFLPDTSSKFVGKECVITYIINDEKYILIVDVVEKPVSNTKVSDNLNSNFKQFCLNNNGMYDVFFYTIIDSNVKNYQVSINDNIVELN